MKVFASKIIRAHATKDEIDLLVRDFKEYKKGGLPATIGRDGDYSYPPSAVKQDLWHIHIGRWSVRARQYDRRSNTMLVYCQHNNDFDVYCLIALLRPDGHKIQRDAMYMAELADEAERFHNSR